MAPVVEDPLGGDIEIKNAGPDQDYPVPPLRVVFMVIFVWRLRRMKR